MLVARLRAAVESPGLAGGPERRSICRPGSASSARRSGRSARRARARRLAIARARRRRSCSAPSPGTSCRGTRIARGSSTQIVLPVAFAALALLGFVVRRARDRGHARRRALGLVERSASTSKRRASSRAHVYRDGVALEARRGSWWFLAARDWDRFDVLVRQLRRAELPLARSRPRGAAARAAAELRPVPRPHAGRDDRRVGGGRGVGIVGRGTSTYIGVPEHRETPETGDAWRRFGHYNRRASARR